MYNRRRSQRTSRTTRAKGENVKSNTLLHAISVAALVCLGLAAWALAQDFDVKKEQLDKPERNYSPAVGQNFPIRVFWGDTHLHTAYSTDAGMAGATVGLDEAYRFARGEEVLSHTKQRVKLRRPLDFLVVADHAELLGLAPSIRSDNPILLQNPVSKRWYEMTKAEKGYEAFIRMGQFPVWQGRPRQEPRHGSRGLGRHAQGFGDIQCARRVHRLHRLRVDLASGGQQPASRRGVPRRRRSREAGTANVGLRFREPST
jgi:Protein of unknown function (DUF3604)